MRVYSGYLKSILSWFTFSQKKEKIYSIWFRYQDELFDKRTEIVSLIVWFMKIFSLCTVFYFELKNILDFQFDLLLYILCNIFLKIFRLKLWIVNTECGSIVTFIYCMLLKYRYVCIYFRIHKIGQQVKIDFFMEFYGFCFNITILYDCLVKTKQTQFAHEYIKFNFRSNIHILFHFVFRITRIPLWLSKVFPF